MKSQEEQYINSPYAELKASDISARIRIYTYAYEFPQATNRDDADWYMNLILLNVNGASAKVDEPIIEGRALECRLDKVMEFARVKTGKVDFSFTEPIFGFELYLDIASDIDIIVKGEMMDSKLNSSKVELKFEFKTDFNMLDKFIVGIKRILNEYPPRYYLS